MANDNQDKQRIARLMEKHARRGPTAPADEWDRISRAVDDNSWALWSAQAPWRVLVPVFGLALVVLGVTRFVPSQTPVAQAVPELTQVELEVLFGETASYADWTSTDPFALGSQEL